MACLRRLSSRHTEWLRQRCSCRRVVYVDRDELNAGKIMRVDSSHPRSVPQVSCGYVSTSQWAVIVDGDSGEELPDEHVGEIWLHGDNVGQGYWGREQETSETFHNKLKVRLDEGSHAGEVAEDANWMRTGDYGVYIDGELYITGRVKDLVIVDGRNHYPQDLEFSAQEASAALRPGFIAAFSVPANQLPCLTTHIAASPVVTLTRMTPPSNSSSLLNGHRAPVRLIRCRLPTRSGPRSRPVTV